MPISTLTGLHERVRAAPAAHIGASAPRTLLAYEFGYDAGLASHGVSPLADGLGGGFRSWVDARVTFTDEHASRLNARSCLSPASYALLLAADEAEALDIYFDLRAEAAADLATSAAPAPCARERIDSAPTTLLGWVALIRRRPAMFFGSAHVSNLWAFCSGFAWAERDHGQRSIDVARMAAFQDWVDERYPFGKGGTWARTFRFLSLAEPHRELACFLEHLDLFLAGQPPDTADPTMETMIAAIVDAAGDPDDDGE